MPASAVLFQSRRLTSQWLKHEHDRELHFGTAVIKSGSTYALAIPRQGNPSGGYAWTTVTSGVIPTGTVMGRIVAGAATSAAKAGGNTGGGTLTLDVTTPVLAGAKAGIYTVRHVGVVANAGQFQVRDPDGIAIGIYAIGGAAFATQIKFAMADSGTDFALGDGFDITVAAGSLKLVPCKYDALDGSNVPVGILFNGVDVTSADVTGVIVEGFAKVAALELVWDTSFDSQGKKDAALAILAQKSIKAVVTQ